ncbi:amidase [Coniochaeta ligniaria NRRL 30616]|uniref:Amidase n=1 Tax=Coniochaeta ligniaria NRRL 30616 TaxID=1408157 RepID=A0A1J7JC40_9PEZI|nr:amidase [Coniochaeta ligniaria NRRL 30616]
MANSDWKSVVQEKRLQRERAIDEVKAILGPELLANPPVNDTDDIETLASKIAGGDLTSEEVTKACIARAIKAHEKTNCLTEVLFFQAINDAKRLDEYMSKHGKPIGPLHGVPMTLKDQFNVKGYDTTLGYAGRALKPASADSVLVAMLRKLGAVIIAKTNLPQSIMWCETENPVWGLTTNPMNPKYTPGGSTGGESALLYMEGSLMGWGTDIGGSIRIPAHMMGLYGLKPSSSRLPYYGVPVSTEGQEHVPSSIGPLARTLSSITKVMHDVITSEPWTQDSRCAPIPWRSSIYDSTLAKPLTIGLLLDDGVVRPHPAILRVVRQAASLLKAAGHEIVEWSSSLHPECVEVMDMFYTVDGGEDIRRDVAAGGEPFIPHVERLVNKGTAVSVYDYWQLNRRKVALQQAYLEKWNGTVSAATGRQVDAVLMPVMPHPAVPHEACRWVGYTKVWNFLDYTALVLPGGKVEAGDCAVAWEYEARNVMDEWNAKVWRENKVDMADMGLPVGIQIVGRKLEEEKVLAVGKVVDDLLAVQRESK